MIIPSVDILQRQAVQLIGGREKVLEAGDPIPLIKQFGVTGEVAVIDLDAALSKGSNSTIIERVVSEVPCRVGGGIRDIETAKRWLDAGARKIILGTRAVPDLLRALPKDRLIAAVDADSGEVVVEGWRTKTGKGLLETIEELQPYVSGFLVTLVEREGRLQGTDLQLVEKIISAAGKARVTIAGGISSPEEIAQLDRLGADAQVGMALYTGRMTLAQAFAAPLSGDRPDTLWPTVVCNERGVALGLTWSNLESLTAALTQRRGIYYSRRRANLWVKGETSGAIQELVRVDLDCDRDTLRFIVRQHGSGFCHQDTMTCWGSGPIQDELFKTLKNRLELPSGTSYSHRLFTEPKLLEAKLLEEAREVVEAISPTESAYELADLIYFSFARAVQQQVSLEDIEKILFLRSLKVSRRPGDAKIKGECSQ